MVRLFEKPFFLNEAQCRWVTDTLARLTDAQKIGQLFCVLGDAAAPEELASLVRDCAVGGVLFRPAPAADLRARFAALDKLAPVPLLKAANLEEGGAGAITDGTYFASNLEAAAAHDEDCVRAFAANCAAEGRSVGINWSFSPVVDIDGNFRNPITNVRTFGFDPDTVRRCARLFVDTLQACGVAAAAKHFPGDGVDYRDQHLHPTCNTLDAGEWFATYGRVYQELIDGGLLSVMAGHIIAPHVIDAVEPGAPHLPGSQSHAMLTGVLRERFGFNGVIITDATIMGGYTMTMPRREALPASIMAGCDMLCFGTDIREDMAYLGAALADGRLTRERLDEAVTRVPALKARVLAPLPALPEQDFAAAQRRCADLAVTLVKDTQNLVPVSAKQYPRIRLVTLGQDETYDGSLTAMAEAFLTQNGFAVERYDPFADDLHGTSALPKDRLTLMLCHRPAVSNQTTVRMAWSSKHALEIPRFVCEEPTAFVSFGNPYHLQDVPRVRTFVNAYAASRATVTAALEKLLGHSAFTGVSPVDPFCGLDDTHL